MRIGVAFSGGLTPSDVVECVKLAEALGYESAWVAGSTSTGAPLSA